MLINESYFDDLEIKDEDIVVDDDNDVEEPKHELTLEEFHKLPEQYGHQIVIKISKEIDSDTTFFQTSLLPKLFKRFDTIFEMYGIEHSEYTLRALSRVEFCDTVIKFGDYQLFCAKYNKDKYINDTYDSFNIYVYVNYSKFNYKRAFRFLYTLVLNLYRMDRHIGFISFYPSANDYVTTTLYFWFEWTPNDIRFEYYDDITKKTGRGMFLCDEEYFTGDYYKRGFYNSVIRHFFGDKVRVPYEAFERDVPLKPIKKGHIRTYCSHTELYN